MVLAGVVTVGLLIVTTTALGPFWFARVSALGPDLTLLAGRALWIALLMPAFSVIHSLFQGRLVHEQKTRGVTEAMALYLAVTAAALAVGVHLATVAGIYFGLGAILLGNAAQAIWLWARSRGVSGRLRIGSSPVRSPAST
jgi:hypothetical protein